MDSLSQEGWALNVQAVEDLNAENAHHAEQTHLRQILLDTDIKKVAVPSLPLDVSHKDQLHLKGPHVLQVVRAFDASQPGNGIANSSKKRMLLVSLTDGKTTVKGLEFRTLTNVNIKQLPPGTKVQIANAAVKCGCLLLDSKCFRVLGGHVEALVEAFEFQQRFQGDRAVPQNGNEATAPKFSHFVPGKTRVPNAYIAAGPLPPSPKGDAPPGLGPARGPERSPAGLAVGHHAARTDAEESPATSESTQALQRQQAERLELDGAARAQFMHAKSQGAAKQKLTERLQLSDKDSGRGRGMRGRGRRRRGFDDEDEPGSMTLAEYEAARQKPSGLFMAAAEPQATDEEIARQMQEQFDLEEAHHSPSEPKPAKLSLADELNQSLFSYDRPEPDTYTGRGRGRGRGRSRGRHRGRR